ncbi:helix-turn-helix domain-containing protein [Streptomyces sp. NPDC088116]|uniref:helix-turn-helix domain-containing protein n=1 Tax=Streptomyces sp. NPDC088116 TaxID=3365825 RepID=UPI00380B23C9
MALQQLSARTRARSGVQATVPPSGVTHQRHRHTERFVVVGNHLAQHRELSFVARGIGVYIQSLPDGAKIGIKHLAAQCPEGEVAIAAALRELEKHGYLVRTRERVPGGRWVTRTVSYDMPLAVMPTRTRTVPTPTVRRPVPRPEPVRTAPAPASAPESAPVPAVVVPGPALPEPGHPDLTRHRTAAELLAGLRRHDPRLILSARDVDRLAPAVSAWLERGVEPAAVQRTLTALLPPEGVRHPAALLGHRLTELLPPPLPAVRAAPRVDPLQNCDRCDRAFRAPEPGDCPACRPADDPLRAAG